MGAAQMVAIGWARKEFTPDRPAMLSGQLYRRVAEEAMDPLTVTALAIERTSGGDPVVIVSIDLLGVNEALLGEIRGRIDNEVAQVSGNDVVVCATHTHSSLVTREGAYGHPGGDVLTPGDARTIISTAAAQAVDAAWASRQPGTLDSALEHAVVGHNRYARYADGHAEMYGDVNREEFVGIGGPEDHTVSLLCTWDHAGQLTGILLAVACPSQVDEHSDAMTADYWHEVRDGLRTHFGEDLGILPLCAAAGDQSPHLLMNVQAEERMRERRGLSAREEIARRIVRATRAAVECAASPSDDRPVIDHRTRRVSLDPVRVTDSDRRAASRALERMTPEEETSNWGERLRGVLQRADSGEPEEVGVELNTLRLGAIGIVTNPFELFLEYGLRINARSVAPQTIPVQLSCGYEGYLPTETARDRGGYGTCPPSAVVGPEGGAELVAASIEELQRAFPG